MKNPKKTRLFYYLWTRLDIRVGSTSGVLWCGVENDDSSDTLHTTLLSLQLSCANRDTRAQIVRKTCVPGVAAVLSKLANRFVSVCVLVSVGCVCVCVCPAVLCLVAL